jgi:hypothetical protein
VPDQRFRGRSLRRQALGKRTGGGGYLTCRTAQNVPRDTSYTAEIRRVRWVGAVRHVGVAYQAPTALEWRAFSSLRIPTGRRAMEHGIPRVPIARWSQYSWVRMRRVAAHGNPGSLPSEPQGPAPAHGRRRWTIAYEISHPLHPKTAELD